MSAKKLAAVSIVLALFAAGETAVVRGRIGLRDFRVNLTAGDRLLHGETPYRISDEHYQFKYAPFSAALYAPFALLPPKAAKALWFALVLAAIVFSVAASSRLAGAPCGRRLALCLAPGIILAKYFSHELELGQINALMTAIFLALTALSALPRTSFRSEIAAGALGGLAAAMKPYGLIILPYLLIKRRWTALVSAVTILAGTYFLPAVYFGFSGNGAVHREWWTTLSRSTPPLLKSQDNISLLGFLSKWSGPAGPSILIYAIVLILLAGLMLAVILKGGGRNGSSILEFALLLLLIPLISPLGWDYTFLSAVLAVALIVGRQRRFPLSGRVLLGLDFFVIAFSLFDLLGRRLYASFMSASVLTLCFLGLIPALVYLRWKGEL
jgi:hypothetical protein